MPSDDDALDRPGDPVGKAPDRRSSLTAAGRAVAVLVLVFHLCAITMANVRRNTALGTSLHEPFDAYVRLAGLTQTWDLFTTKPRFESIEFDLAVKDHEGREVVLGPVVPGFGPPEHQKVMVTFARMALAQKAYARGNRDYARAACAAAEEKLGARPRSVQLRARMQSLRSVQQVRKDGKISQMYVPPTQEVECKR